MIIDPKEVVKNNLREGETVRSVMKNLQDLAQKHMLRHFDGLLHNLHLQRSMTRDEFIARYKIDEKVRRDYSEEILKHFVGYTGEIAVLGALGRDWHAVHDSNDINKFEIPDGKVNGFEYDVKTKYKDEDGLSVAESKIKYDFYILCYYRSRLVRIAGYALKEQLLSGRRFSYRDGTSARALRLDDKLHDFDEFLRLFKR